MKTSANIYHGSHNFGKINFEPNQLIRLIPQKGVSKIKFLLYPTITLDLSSNKMIQPCVWNVSGSIYGKSDRNSQEFYLGELSSQDFYFAPMNEGSRCEMHWYSTMEDILAFEEFRNGKPPIFKIDLFALTRFNNRFIVNNEECYAPTSPRRYYETFEIDYPINLWHERIKVLGLRNYCLMEINTLPDNTTPKNIHESIQKALNRFNDGGSIGWRDCVGSSRIALEKMKKLYPGTFQHQTKKPKEQTKPERINKMIQDVKHLTNLPHHDDEEEWSRDEALLVLNNVILLNNLLLKYESITK